MKLLDLKNHFHVDFKNVVRIAYCFAQNESITFATFLTLEWILKATNYKQLTNFFVCINNDFPVEMTYLYSKDSNESAALCSLAKHFVLF